MFVQLIIQIVFTLIYSQLNLDDDAHQNFRFYVGTYTDQESEGIYEYEINTNGKLELIGLKAISNNPSYLALSDNNYLIAVNEIDENNSGYIESFKIENDSLILINKSKTGGAHPCHVSINKEGLILTSNYTGGNIALHRLSSKGELSELLDVEFHKGKGVHERQDGPHAHSAWFYPNSDEIISLDLGTNELWFSNIDSSFTMFQPKGKSNLQMAPGAGPRHLDFHPNSKWVYVLNELNNTVTLVERNVNDEFKILESFTTLSSEFKLANKSADIHVSTDGNYLYTSNRGQNTIAIFQIDQENGFLKLVDSESTQGETPRNFKLTPDGKYLVVANKDTNSIVSFSRNSSTGLLTFIDKVSAPSPACILFKNGS